MFSILSFILMVHLSIGEDPVLVTELPDDASIAACRQQTTYALASWISSPLTIKLYYSAGTKPDTGFITAMCTAMAAYPDVTYLFFPGDSVKQGKNGLECLDANAKKSHDCTCNFQHACASQLVRFDVWVCCNSKGGSPADCIKEQDESKVEEFNQCVQLQDPNIKPDEILLNNANAGKQIDNPSGCKPMLLFNDNLQDKCARYMFYEDPVKVVKALLA